MSYLDSMGITGVTLEAKTCERWAAGVSSEDAAIAVSYATIEIAGFPSWLSDLAVAKPEEVRAVLRGEIVAAPASPEPQYDMLDDIRRFGGKVMELMAPVLLEQLEERHDLPPAALSSLLDIINRGLRANRERFAAVAIDRFRQFQ